MKFYDRTEELEKMRAFAVPQKKRGRIVVLYGRRRIGKTTLIKKAFADRNNFLYFFVARKEGKILLRDFSEILSKFLSEKGVISGEFTSWESFFGAIFSYARKQEMVVVFDEFQNFLHVDRSLFSTIQNLWDQSGKESGILMLFTGSYVGMIKKIFREEKEPLYGRTDHFLNLGPFDFPTVCGVLSDMGIGDIEERIRFYSVIGGVPRYLELLEDMPHRNFAEFMEHFVREDEFLIDEGERILSQEFGREYLRYFAVLEAISLGKATLTEISDWTGESRTSVSRYIHDLSKEYEIIKRVVPVTEDRRRSKRGRYFIGDNFYRFWFRYVYRNTSYFEIGNHDHVVREILEENNAFVGPLYENIWKKALPEMSGEGKLPFRIGLIGPWWERSSEIDIVALNEKSRDILFAEVKWSNRPVKKRVLTELEKKAENVRWHRDNRKEHYAIISKRGIDRELKNLEEAGEIIHFSLKDLEEWVESKEKKVK